MRMIVEADKKMIANVSERLGEFEKQAPAAISRSLNRAVTNVRATARKEVRQTYNIKAGDVSETIKVQRSTKSDLRAEVRSKGSPIGLDKFKISPKTINPKRKTPIKIGVKKGTMARVMGAFVADINGPKAFERTSSSRLPIKRLFGPSVPQMLDNKKVSETVRKQGRETFDKRLEHEIERILSKGRARA